MEVNLTRLEKYFEEKKCPINIGINIVSPYEPIIVFTRGKYEEEGSNRVYLEFKDIDDLLILNNITTPNGLLKTEREGLTTDLKNGLGLVNKREEKMEELIYGTLFKYIYQMHHAYAGKLFFSEIKHLTRHDTYFKNE